ncbi:MAG: Druantia anti-phage system protein DruA, partial [Planctomycetota bacterium]
MSRWPADPPLRYCGRDFSAEEIEQIRRLIASNPQWNRAQLSRRVCDVLRWHRPDGRRKDMSCRVAMLRMQRDELIALPRAQKTNGNGHRRPRLTAASEPREPIALSAQALGSLHLRPVNTLQDSGLWNELIERYHYLGYQPLPGAQMRYLVFSGPHRLAALGFGAAAWKVAPRDRFIGWTAEQRAANLHRIVNNARFLILPWVTGWNLASRILAAAARRVVEDWTCRYGHSPVLLETFVERDRFRGTCY